MHSFLNCDTFKQNHCFIFQLILFIDIFIFNFLGTQKYQRCFLVKFFLQIRQLKTSQVCSLFFRPLAQHYPGVGDSPLVYRSSPILAEESKQVGKYRIGQVRQVRIGRCPSFFSLQKGKKAFAPPICLCCPRTSLLFFLNLSLAPA